MRLSIPAASSLRHQDLRFFPTLRPDATGRAPGPASRAAPAPSRHGPWLRLLALLVCAPLLLAPAATGAAAQTVPAEGPAETPERSRFSGTIAVLNTQPLGGLATGPGIGVAASAAWALDEGHYFRLRGEFRGAGYGSESRRSCLSETVGCLIQVDVTTSYATFYIGAGPELALPVAGGELVLDATAGLGSFAVTSSVQGISDSESLLSTTNFQDDFFAWSAGGELRFPLSRQASLSVGAHYQHNGNASYVPEGGITLNGDGTVDVAALTTDANFMAITLGLSFRPFVGWARDDDAER